jgi:hypothetical protein
VGRLYSITVIAFHTVAVVRKTAHAPEAEARLTEQLEVLYDHYRDACLNQKYYGHRYVHAERWNKGLEIAIAIGSATSTIGAWPLWQSGVGKVIWAGIAGISTILAVLKPFINYPAKLKRLDELHVGYVGVTAELRELVNSVRINGGLSGDALAAHQAASKMLTKLARQDEPNPNRKLIQRLEVEVNREIPADRLWVPSAHAAQAKE